MPATSYCTTPCPDCGTKVRGYRIYCTKCAEDRNKTSKAKYVEKMRRHKKCQPSLAPETATPLSSQIGGSHYKQFAIQPIEFIIRNNIPGAEALALRYICRHRLKNGREDLEKAIHILQILLEVEYDGKKW